MLAIATAFLLVQAQATLKFSGYEWNVRQPGLGGPGPNQWDPRNVWVDSNGFLHIRITNRDGKWSCAEVSTKQKLGYGTYEFWVNGPIDRFDPNIVLGLFSYPSSDVGKDTTHEVDIEFARWGIPTAKIGNYAVWPVNAALKLTGEQFEFKLDSDATTHRFIRKPDEIFFQSLRGHRSDNREEIKNWRFKPTDHDQRVSKAAMPLHINLWLFQGKPPTDSRDVEIVIRKFSFRKS